MKYIAILFAGMLAFAWQQTPARAADQGSAPAPQAQQGDQNASRDNGQQTTEQQQLENQQQVDPEPAVEPDDQSDEGHQIGSDSAE